MKNRSAMVGVILAMALLGAGAARADSIQPEHRKCEKDADCDVIVTGCDCCGTAARDTVNHKFYDQYKALADCSVTEANACNNANCRPAPLQSAVCSNHVCTLSGANAPVNFAPNAK